MQMIGVKNRKTGTERCFFLFNNALAYAERIQRYELRKDADLFDWLKNLFKNRI